jgi:hypothetical protein
LVLLVFTVATRPSRAWWEDGHNIVAGIAESHLSQKARAGIKQLIGDRSIADGRIAVWADFIKGNRAFKTVYPNNDKWHYVDIPFEAERFVAERDCKNGDCIISAISRFRAVLADGSADKTKRKEALMFLVHFVGDLHQPLHCAERNHDQGGNLLRVTYLGKEQDDNQKQYNLHRVWDDNLVREGKGDLKLSDYIRRLDAAIVAEEARQWQKNDVASWAWEGHQIAVASTYRQADGKTELPRQGPVKLDEAYVSKNKTIVKNQLQKAGIRLAFVLNRAFDPDLLGAGGKEDKPIAPAAAAKQVGQKCTLAMEIQSTGKTRDGRLIFLNSEASFRNESNFTLVIDGQAQERFKKASIADPAAYFKGKHVQATGTITLYKKKPEIRIDDPSQIKIVDTQTKK